VTDAPAALAAPLPEGPAPAPPPVRKGPRVAVLLAFLGAFLLLIVLFRAVLFPFLMAMFLAYLVEPVVGWMGRGKRFGIRWSRGPIILVMYALVLTGLFFLVLEGWKRLERTAERFINLASTEFEKRAEKVRFVLEKEPAKQDIVVPRGTRVLYARAGTQRVFETVYPTRIHEGESEAVALLEPVDGRPVRKREIPKVEPGAELLPYYEVTLAPDSAVLLPKDARIEARPQATGFEKFLENHVVAPLSLLIERLSGEPYDPVTLRRWLAEESEHRGQDVGKNVVGWAQGAVIGVGKRLYMLVLVLMLTAFIVIDRKNISSFFASLPPQRHRPQYHVLMAYVDRGLAGVIRGQLLICLVNGLLTWLGLVILGIKYAAVLGFVAGVFSLIPVFGTIASSIPIVLVAITGGGLEDGVLALAWITLIHLLEANLLNPLIMGTNAEMHPVVIIFALLAGEHAFGVWGALLAVPTASIIQSCFKYYRHEIEGVPHEAPHGHGQWIRRLVGRARARREAQPATGGGNVA
jgi:predicted PurR-regulated permease PerM